MAIPVKCPTCQASMRAADSQSGKIAKCPKCKSLIHIPDAETSPSIAAQEPPPFVPPIVKEEATPFNTRVPPPTKSIDYKGIAWKVLLVLIGSVWLVTIRQPGGGGFLHYVCLIAGLCAIIASLLPKNWISVGVARNWIVFLLALAVTWGWFLTDYSITTWNEYDSETEGTKYVSDYCWRLSDQPYYRDLLIDFDDGSDFRAKGSFSDSGKMHGHWSRSVTLADNEDREPQMRMLERDGYKSDFLPYWLSKESWYWYGEEITEGEWHLRNK